MTWQICYIVTCKCVCHSAPTWKDWNSLKLYGTVCAVNKHVFWCCRDVQAQRYAWMCVFESAKWQALLSPKQTLNRTSLLVFQTKRPHRHVSWRIVRRWVCSVTWTAPSNRSSARPRKKKTVNGYCRVTHYNLSKKTNKLMWCWSQSRRHPQRLGHAPVNCYPPPSSDNNRPWNFG